MGMWRMSAQSNFTGMDSLKVTCFRMSNGGALVGLHQHKGSLRFQFDLTPSQARALAKILTEEAERAEGLLHVDDSSSSFGGAPRERLMP
jgi:hypothetical protein